MDDWDAFVPINFYKLLEALAEGMDKKTLEWDF